VEEEESDGDGSDVQVIDDYGANKNQDEN